VEAWAHRARWQQAQIYAVLKPTPNAHRLSFLSHLSWNWAELGARLLGLPAQSLIWSPVTLRVAAGGRDRIKKEEKKEERELMLLLWSCLLALLKPRGTCTYLVLPLFVCEQWSWTTGIGMDPYFESVYLRVEIQTRASWVATLINEFDLWEVLLLKCNKIIFGAHAIWWWLLLLL